MPLLALVGVSTMEGDEKARFWLARVELIDILAWGALAALLAITSYRAYEEYYLPRRRLQAWKPSSRVWRASQRTMSHQATWSAHPRQKIMSNKPNCWQCCFFKITHLNPSFTRARYWIQVAATSLFGGASYGRECRRFVPKTAKLVKVGAQKDRLQA